MTKKEDKEEGYPLYHRGCEIELTIGNFACSLKSTHRLDSVDKLTRIAVSLYEHALKINGNNLDPGVR